MKSVSLRTLSLFVAGSVALLGCPSDDASDGDDDAADETTDGSATAATATNATVTATTTMTTTDPDTSATMTTMVDTSATGDTDATAGSESTTVDQTEFQFNPTAPEDYTRVDRKGFPAVNTGLHIHGDKDEYNANDPESDLGAYFDMSAMEAIESLLLLHFGPDESGGAEPTGLDEELTDLGLAVCDPFTLGPGTCVNQGGGAATYPDTLKIDLDLDPGFHLDPMTCAPVANGRALANPVIDIILAVLLLDLATPLPDGVGLLPCPNDPDTLAPVTAFLGIPDGMGGTFTLNPVTNDVAFQDAFPYVAPAH